MLGGGGVFPGPVAAARPAAAAPPCGRKAGGTSTAPLPEQRRVVIQRGVQDLERLGRLGGEGRVVAVVEVEPFVQRAAEAVEIGHRIGRRCLRHLQGARRCGAKRVLYSSGEGGDRLNRGVRRDELRALPRFLQRRDVLAERRERGDAGQLLRVEIDLLAVGPDPVAQQDVVDLAFLRQLREVELVERLDPAVGKAALCVEPRQRSRYGVEAQQQLPIGRVARNDVAQLARRQTLGEIRRICRRVGERPLGGRRQLALRRQR